MRQKRTRQLWRQISQLIILLIILPQLNRLRLNQPMKLIHQQCQL